MRLLPTLILLSLLWFPSSAAAGGYTVTACFGPENASWTAWQPTAWQPPAWQPAELIVFIRICAGQIEDAIRSACRDLVQTSFELGQKAAIADTVR